MAKSESTKIEFGYFHDYESEQFAFYRIPKVLFTDEYFRNLSSDAKVLYKIKVLNTINFKKSMHYNRATCSPLKRRRTALFQSVL